MATRKGKGNGKPFFGDKTLGAILIASTLAAVLETYIGKDGVLAILDNPKCADKYTADEFGKKKGGKKIDERSIQ